MKHLKINDAAALVAGLFYALIPEAVQAADQAAPQQGHRMTLPQLLVFGIIMGWYLCYHFKDKIRALFTKKQRR